MLARRSLLMTATGLLTSYLAAGQTPATAPAPSGSDALFWVLVGVLGLVALLVVVVGTSVASATSSPYWQQQRAAPEVATHPSSSTSTKPEAAAC
ncbi:hypothetical protein ACFPAF_16675 [Hymenobacter endophyticus]|uniref:Uncharacterized protein n=1 Tax=Hymenobacter endophyticus TaxID=3076335 RepID=A0ABU3TKZ4_9BACT|nr:hypothetical protein [Hymenobacter endophyticus]MDU0372040.1 hypothetical protein [Hymenobacter endophyticus]